MELYFHLQVAQLHHGDVINVRLSSQEVGLINFAFKYVLFAPQLNLVVVPGKEVEEWANSFCDQQDQDSSLKST